MGERGEAAGLLGWSGLLLLGGGRGAGEVGDGVGAAVEVVGLLLFGEGGEGWGAGGECRLRWALGGEGIVGAGGLDTHWC